MFNSGLYSEFLLLYVLYCNIKIFVNNINIIITLLKYYLLCLILIIYIYNIMKLLKEKNYINYIIKKYYIVMLVVILELFFNTFLF